MSLTDLRCDRKIEQEKSNAAQATVNVPSGVRSVIISSFALAFVGLLASLALGIGTSASADLNLSFVVTMFQTIFQAATNAMPSFEAFIDAGFPVLVKVIVYIAIIGIIFLPIYLLRGIIMAVIRVIETTVGNAHQK